MFLNGSRQAVVENLQLIDIHGTRLVDITFRHDGESELRRARIGTESVTGPLQVGDRVVVSYVMGVVTAVARSS